MTTLETMDPLFPLTSRAVRRATAWAEAMDLVAVPYAYDMVVPPEAAGQTSFVFNVTFASAQGPVAVVDIVPPTGRQRALASIQQDGVYATDGVVVVGDAFTLPRYYHGQLLSSPLCFAGGSMLRMNLDDDTPWEAGEGLRVVAIGVRKRVEGGRELGPVSDAAGTAWLRAVADDGVWWGSSIESTAGHAEQQISGDIVIESITVATATSAVEGISPASLLSILIGSHQLTPLALDPRLGARLDVNGVISLTTLLPGLRMPTPSKTKIQVQAAAYPAGTTTRLPYRVTLVGRRGGIAGACW